MGEGDIAVAIANARSYLTANRAEARYRIGGVRDDRGWAAGQGYRHGRGLARHRHGHRHRR